MKFVNIFELSFYVFFYQGGYPVIIFLLLMSQISKVVLTLREPALETSQLVHLIFDATFNLTINFDLQII